MASTLGVPEGTVKARLSRGRAALAVLLDDTDRTRENAMSELRDLRDLAREVGERAVPPAYERSAGGSPAPRLARSAALWRRPALSVGGVAVWQSVARRPADGSPAAEQRRSRRPTRATGGRRRRDLAHPFDISATDDGAIAVVWRALDAAAAHLRVGRSASPTGRCMVSCSTGRSTLSPSPAAGSGCSRPGAFFITQ